MAREILKKSLDGESGSDDDFEASLQQQLEKEFSTASSNSDMELGRTKSVLTGQEDVLPFTPEVREEAGHKFSLDDFEIPDLSDPKEEESPKASQQPASDSKKKKKTSSSPQRKIALNKMIIIGVPVLVLGALVAVFALKAGKSSHPAPSPKITTLIRHSIVLPDFQEDLVFFILSGTQEEKNIVTLTLGFLFHNPERHRRFKAEKTLVRDVVYRFLESKPPPRNSRKEWQKIVQSELQEHLKTILPQSLADSISVNQMSKL
jgi:flagellar basal body-associated protein FliL